jgi:pilus assembly protein CpaB
MSARRTPLIVGLILALGTGLLLLNFLARAQGVAAGTAQRSVVVALREIPARAEIKPDMIATATRATDQVDSDAVGDTKDVTNHVALITIPAGSTVTASKVAKPAALALPMRLRHGLRAVSVAIDRVKGVAGLIQPGDRVDVIAVPQRVGNETPKAATILRGVLVLALGNETETPSATPAPDNENLTTVTLAVSPRQANLLAEADVYGTLRLALRSPEESLASYPPEAIVLGSTEAPVSAPAAAPAPAPIAAAPEKPAAPAHVPVVEGDQFAPAQENAR